MAGYDRGLEQELNDNTNSMIDKKTLYTIGEIIEKAGLPVFIRRARYDIDFFVEITSVADGIASGEGYKGTNPIGRTYQYETFKLAYYCDWQDVKDSASFILPSELIYFPSSLPARALGRFHEYINGSLPNYIPGKTILPVKRNGQWVNAVFTGFEERNGKVLIYTYHSGKETFCVYGGNLVKDALPEDYSDSQVFAAKNDLSGRTTSRNEILDFLKHERGVSCLVHFTPIDNLNSIIKNGIAPRIYFEDGDDIVVTDSVRYDNHLECSCFSLSFPNYQMFEVKRRWTHRKYAVLIVDIDALSDRNVDAVYFLPVNASYREVRWNITNYDQLQDAKNMFAEELTYQNRTILRNDLSIPDEYTTCPQAEVMVDGIIPSEYIREVHFLDERTFYDAAKTITKLPHDTVVKCSRKYFLQRKDSAFW